MTKRRVHILAAVTGLGLLATGAARATYIWTPVVTAEVEVDRGELFVDFSDDPKANPTPVHGYVYLHSDGSLSCHASGGPSGGPSGPDPLFTDDGRCDPLH